MENEKYPEFNVENEEVIAKKQEPVKFDADEYEKNRKKYKRDFFISLILSIVLFLTDIADLIHMFSNDDDRFKGLSIILAICMGILDALCVTSTVSFYNRWKEYE